MRFRRGLCLAAMVLGGCKHRDATPPTPRVVAIEVADRSPGGLLDDRKIAERAAAALRRSNLFEVLDPGVEKPLASGQSAWRCRVDVGAAAEHEGPGGMLRAMAEVECKPTGAGGADVITARALADKPFDKAPDGSDDKLRQLAGRLVEDTVGLIVRQHRLRTGPMADLLAALKDPDADVRRVAIRAAAFRRAREAVPAVTALLDDPQQDIRDMALGALTDIGDPKAVKAITSRVKFSDTDELRKIIDPVASLGGDEAREFLEFVGSGSEDPDVRKMARSALERMDRRAQAR